VTFTQVTKFTSIDDYLSAELVGLPEGRYEYCDGELLPVMAESGLNDAIANYLFLVLVNSGIPFVQIRPHSCEVEVLGKPQTRWPDLTLLDPIHVQLLERRNTITRQMLPPRLVVEVVSPGDEHSDNYQRDDQVKPQQYAAIGIPEYWIVDPDRSVVLIGTLRADHYDYQEFRRDEAIGSPTLQSLAVTDLNLTAQQLLNAGR
jgi:Uma2 family endonuclease